MIKKYVVRLSKNEREKCQQMIKQLKGTSQTVRRAQLLLKAGAEAPAWADAWIEDAFGCRTRTNKKIQHKFVLEGFEIALYGRCK